MAMLLLVVAAAPAGAQPPTTSAQTATQSDNEIDLFMEQVLDNREASWRRVGDFLLREIETFDFEAPFGVPMSGFHREYDWYVRDDVVVRSPVRFDGVELDDATRRQYEDEWLERERRRSPPGERARPLLSRRDRATNIALTVERDWGGALTEPLRSRVLADAELLGDDMAAIALNTGALLEAFGGVEGVGFGAAVAHTRVLFVMLDTERLSAGEVTRALRRPLLMLVDALELALHAEDEEEALAGFVELAELAVHFELDARDLDGYLDRGARRLEPFHADVATTLDELRGNLGAGPDPPETARAPDGTLLDDGRFEPDFASESYFMEFNFEPGNYYFVGRETLAGREVVKLEYYPTNMFDGDGNDPGSEFEERIDRGFNKTTLVTLWVDPEQHQVVKYTFDNTGLDFLPARWLVRIDGLSATMEMGQPLGDVWLPVRMTVEGRATTALGDFDLEFVREFLDYRETATGGRIVDVEAPR